MGHQEFLKKYDNNEIKVHIDKNWAGNCAVSGFLHPGYKIYQRFLVTISTSLIIGAIPIGIWYSWWVGILSFVGAGIVAKYWRRIITKGAFKKMIDDPNFFEFATALSGGATIEEIN